MISKAVVTMMIIIALHAGMNWYAKDHHGHEMDAAKDNCSATLDADTFLKVKQAMQCEDIYIEIILEHFLKAGINEVYEAYIVEDNTSAIVLEIKSENEKVYHVYCNSSYLFKAIRDMETGKLIYAVIQ